jgi:hypothetical protein
MDTSWIAASSREVAKDAQELLDEVIPQMDLLKRKILVSPYPPYAHHNWDHDLREQYIEERMDVANMLMLRGVLKSAKVVQTDDDDAIAIQADRDTVVQTRDLLMKKLYGAIGATPIEAVANAMMASERRPRRRKTLETFKEAFVKAAGTTAGEAVMAGVGAGILALLYILFH